MPMAGGSPICWYRSSQPEPLCAAGTTRPFMRLDNVVATPHIAGVALENWMFRVRTCWGNLQRVWEGKEPQNVVNAKIAP